MTRQITQLASILKADSGVAPDYRHVPKCATPGETLKLSGAVLKWYAVHPDDQRVPERITQLARSYLSTNPLEARGLGFVILHRCGNDFYFLIVSTWRNNNELWETVFYKNGDAMTDFAPWPRDDVHKPTFCVWELVPLWHEKQVWERFLKSSRDEAAAQVLAPRSLRRPSLSLLESLARPSRQDRFDERLGNYRKSLADYERVLSLQPREGSRGLALSSRAWLRAACPDASFRNGKQAVKDAKGACNITRWKNADYIDTLAAACAEAGDFDAAVQYEEKAIALLKNADESKEEQQRLAMYRQRQPFRDAPK